MAETTRSKILVPTKIAGIEFVATSVKGGGSRRLNRAPAIGVDGEGLDDLGEGARVEEFEARLDEAVYQQLEEKRRDAKVYAIQHPLFGVFQGRIESINYTADSRNLVNATIVVVEDGDATFALAPVTVSFPKAGSSAKANNNLFSDALTDLDGLDGIPDSVSTASANAQSAADAFNDGVDAVENDDASWQDLGADFDNLGSSTNDFIDAFDAAAPDLPEMYDTGAVDAAYNALASARDAVDAAQRLTAMTWQPSLLVEDVSVSALARDWLPDLTEADAIDQILESNPGILDLNVVPAGVELLIPVPL
jgi:hypothetical protein